MSRPNTAVNVAIALLAFTVAAYAACNWVVGQRYTLTGTMAQCHEHQGTFFIVMGGAGSGGGSHSARAGSDHDHGERLMLKAATPQVNLQAIFTSLQPGQKITATGVYLGETSPGPGHDELHKTLRAESVVAKPLTPREAKFQSLYDLRRQ